MNTQFETEKIVGEIRVTDEKYLRFRIIKYPSQKEAHVDIRTWIKSPDFMSYKSGIQFPVSLWGKFQEQFRSLQDGLGGKNANKTTDKGD